MSFSSVSRRAWPLALLAVVSLAACRKDRFADGIGRPTQEPIDSPTLSGVTIVEVKPSGTTPPPFVELLGPADFPLTGFTLQTPNQSLALTGTIPAGGRLRVDTPTLFNPAVPSPAVNPAQSGEVALVDAAGIVHSYLAWGTDPSATASSFFARALQSGATGAAGVIPVPFPRPPESAIVREGPIVGCNAPTPNAPPTATPCAAPATTLALREVAPHNSPRIASFIELENTSPDPLDLTGVRLCHDGECVPLGLTLSGGVTLTICLGPVDPASGITCPGTVAIAGSTAIEGDTEIFLAAPGASAQVDGTALLDYMRTHGGRDTLAAAAIADGLWLADAAPLGTYVPGESLARKPGVLLPPVWNPARATPGAPNPTIDRVTNWQTCTEPAAAPGTSSDVVASLVSRLDGTITLTNIGSADVSLAQLLLTVDDVEVLENGVELAGVVRPGASRTVAAAVSDSGKLEVRLRAGNLPVQFAQWGNPASGVTSAVAASLWPREDCVLPRLATGESLVARLGPAAAGSRDRALLRGSSAFDVQ